MGYKLHYFDVRYWAEPARMMFHAAGVEFEDITYTHLEWPEIKKIAPTGKVPWLEVDGHTIVESWAINRFLAKRFGFNGQDEFEEALIDSTAHFFRNYHPDVFQLLVVASGWGEGDEDTLYKEKAGPALDAIFGFVKKCLEDSKSGFIVKSGPTWIDLVLAENVIVFDYMIPTFKDKFPDALEYKERVHNHPKFKKFADTRKDYKIGYLQRKEK